MLLTSSVESLSSSILAQAANEPSGIKGVCEAVRVLSLFVHVWFL